jgi:pimeloyl-ACP methyl ester carboxylesterase
MIDARGHGLSESPESGYDTGLQAADVAAVIDALELTRPVLIGHSMGAHVAAATAAYYTDKVGALVLEDPPWRSDMAASAEERLQRAESIRNRVTDLRSMSLEELIALCQREHPDWDEAEWFQWAKAKQQVKPQVADFVKLGMNSDWREIAARIDCPVLLITGDTVEGAIVTPELSKQAARFWRKGKVVHIPGSGHNIRREQFDLFLDTVRKYLANVDTKPSATKPWFRFR